MTNNSLITQVRQRLAKAERILVVSHTRPDGDAIGSVLALGLALKNLGKDVQMVLADGVPAPLRFMPSSNLIKKKPEGEFDLVAVVDCSNLERAGKILEEYNPIGLNIDHHPDNSHFAEINLVEDEASSVTEILATYLTEFGLEFSPEISANLLTGMMTDTLGFQTRSMRPQTLRVAATLFEQGAQLTELYYNALEARSFEAAQYWGAGLSQLQREGPLVWTTLSLENRKKTNYPGRDDADLVRILSSINGTKIAMIFIQQDEKTVKVSWRTRDSDLDVSQVAHQFGGGGHHAAAGAMISGSFDEVITKVVEKTKTALR